MHTDLNDLNLINELSKGKIDLTYGRLVKILFFNFLIFQTEIPCLSSLNIFGGDKVRIEDLIDWNKINKQ